MAARLMAVWLRASSGAADASWIRVAIEVPHGPVVETLIERGHAIDPKQMDRLGDRFTLAGAASALEHGTTAAMPRPRGA